MVFPALCLNDSAFLARPNSEYSSRWLSCGTPQSRFPCIFADGPREQARLTAYLWSVPECLVRAEGFEPPSPLETVGPKPTASASAATPATVPLFYKAGKGHSTGMLGPSASSARFRC